MPGKVVPCLAEGQILTRCSIVGDPHYTTFDGLQYDFAGHCSYTLVQQEDFTIEAENVPCGGALSWQGAQGHYGPGQASSCTKSLTIRSQGHVVRLRQRMEVLHDSEEVARLPAVLSPGILVTPVSSLWLTASLPGGVTVWWDGHSRAHVDLPRQYRGQVAGLCGTFTQQQGDEFKTPEGDVEDNPEDFANK